MVGPVAGRITTVAAADTNTCSGNRSESDHDLVVGFAAAVPGQTYKLRFQLSYLDAAGMFQADTNKHLVLSLQGSETGQSFTADSGTFTVNPGGEGGSLDVGMFNDSFGPGDVEHLFGTWSCKTEASSGGAASTPEDLTLSGHDSGHIALADQDPTSAKPPATCAATEAFGTRSFAVGISGRVGTARWNLDVMLQGNGVPGEATYGYAGAGAYKNAGNRVTLTPSAGNPAVGEWVDALQAFVTSPSGVAQAPPNKSVGVTIDPGEKSGSIDAVVHQRIQGATGPELGPSQIHITGRFNCG
jgi:hypothetical protein